MGIFSAKICWLLLAVSLQSCGPFPDMRGIINGDLEPPIYVSATSTASRCVVLEFNEPVFPAGNGIALTPTIQPNSVDCTANEVLVTFETPLEPGKEYAISATVKDEAGNQTRLVTSIYGYNPRVPSLLINEFITQGSSTHPDVVELLVLSDGNTAGVCIYEGVKENWSDRGILPACLVSAGDYIIIHFKPDGTAEEVNEVSSKSDSGGKDASDRAWDYWVPGGNGLSGNNGTITVYSDPKGSMIDGVLYSNRFSSSDDKYRGFGTKDVMNRADFLFSGGGWVARGDTIAPEDGINPDPSTSTRSVCRQSIPDDTNTKADWHVVPTRGSSFGEINNDEIYVREE